MNFDNINLCDATEQELRHLERMVHEEVIKREKEKETRAIKNFKKAFEELLQFVDIFYEDDGEFADLRYFDNFKFE